VLSKSVLSGILYEESTASAAAAAAAISSLVGFGAVNLSNHGSNDNTKKKLI
jgi:hypothetical protein